jgi:serine/arginine repetitive matrix protein 2
MFLDICKRHGLEIDEEPSYGGRQYLEKQDYIRMKQKEEIAVQQEMLNQQRDKVNANHLELARQSNHVRANEKVIQSQKEKIEQQEKEFKENFISNSDRILSQGELIEEQREELQQLTLRIEDVETLLDEVSSEAYDKAVDKVAEETMRATRKDDIRLAEDSKRWIQSPERKASRKEKEYAINRLDGLIKKIEYAMEKAVVRVVRQLKQPEKKKAVVEEIKKEVKPSIREKLALNVAKIQREEAERKQLNKGRSHSSDLEL